MTGACPAHDKSVSSGLDNLLFCLVIFFVPLLSESFLAAAGFRIGKDKRKTARIKQSSSKVKLKPEHSEILRGQSGVARSRILP